MVIFRCNKSLKTEMWGPRIQDEKGVINMKRGQDLSFSIMFVGFRWISLNQFSQCTVLYCSACAPLTLFTAFPVYLNFLRIDNGTAHYSLSTLFNSLPS